MNDAERLKIIILKLNEIVEDLEAMEYRTQFKRVEEPKIGDSL